MCSCVALAAGGVAALLAGSDDEPPPAAPAPVVQLETVDVLVAKSDIGIGHVDRRAGPALAGLAAQAATGANFIRKTDRPNAIEELTGSIARAPFAAGEPIREAKLIKAQRLGLHGRDPAAGMRAVSTEISPETGAGGFILPNDRVDVILSRRDREAEKAAGVEVAHQRNHPDQRARAGDRPDRRGEGRPARRGRQDRDARARRRARPRRSRCRASSARCRSRCAAWSTPSKTRAETDDDAASSGRHQHRPFRRQHR